MKSEYNLSDFGIEPKLYLHGQMKIILKIDNAPILFLFDEYHTNQDCKNENIENAKELIEKANVKLIAVEGFEGGYEYDYFDFNSYTNRYINGEISEHQRIGNSPEFAHGVKEFFSPVVGIDCRGLSDKMEVDVYKEKWEAENIGNHPFQKERSIHFIKTIIEEYNRLRCNGAIILNGGSRHNDDIINMAKDREKYPELNLKFSLIRLRPTSHPTSEF